MTHQKIASAIEAVNDYSEHMRKIIEKEHQAKMGAIQEKCAALGHIYILSHRFSILGASEQSNYACAVCGSWRKKDAERTAPVIDITNLDSGVEGGAARVTNYSHK